MTKAKSPDYWRKEGRVAARRLGDDWPRAGEAALQQARAQSQAMVASLRCQGVTLQAQEQACVANLNAGSKRPRQVLQLNLVEGLIWLAFAVFFFWAGYQLALHTLPLLGRFEEGRHVLAGIFAFGTAIAVEECIRRLARVLPQHVFRTWLLFLSLTPVLCLLAGSLTMSLLRSDYAAIQQVLELQQDPAVVIEGSAQQRSEAQSSALADEFYRRSRKLTSLLMFLASAGLEIVAGLALHEAGTRLLVSVFTLAEQRRLRQLRLQIEHCAQLIEEWRAYPDIVNEAFTRGALLGTASDSSSDSRQERHISVSIALLVFIVCFALVFFLFVNSALANEAVIVALDLSTSSAGDEFKANTDAVAKIIGRLAPGSRLTIMPINEKSFSSPAILEASLSPSTGLFAERVKAARLELNRAWKHRCDQLRADAPATDIFGALFKASVLREELGGRQVALILLSDMRQVGRGYNFETSHLDLSLVDRAEREGLISPLKHVQVWALGAHAAGVSDVYWRSLRTLWTEYFKRAGATLKAFSPNRRWNDE